MTAKCVAPGQSAPDGAWVCPEPKTVECDASELAPQNLYVRESETVSCQEQALTVSSPGPLVLGTHTVTLSDASGAAICSAPLTVRDTKAPVVVATETIALWPPNHKFHSVAVGDCVEVHDACDSAARAEFIWASSDEPVNALGDGNHEPDIRLEDCQHVALRAERQGPEDGRVYTLGVRVTDASGHMTEATCRVIVAHDQSGKARSADGETISAATENGRGSSRAKASEADRGKERAGKGGAAGIEARSANAVDAGMPAIDPSDGANDGAKADVAVANAEAYRIVFDGSDGSNACGNASEPDADGGVPDEDAGLEPDEGTPSQPDDDDEQGPVLPD